MISHPPLLRILVVFILIYAISGGGYAFVVSFHRIEEAAFAWSAVPRARQINISRLSCTRHTSIVKPESPQYFKHGDCVLLASIYCLLGLILASEDAAAQPRRQLRDDVKRCLRIKVTFSYYSVYLYVHLDPSIATRQHTTETPGPSTAQCLPDGLRV